MSDVSEVTMELQRLLKEKRDGDRRARLCSRDNRTGKVWREDWRPVAEAELYLVRRKSLEGSRISWSVNWIEYDHDLPD